MVDVLQDKIAIVTGAGRGIGRAEALALAAEGAKVVVNDYGVERDGTGTSGAPADDVVAEIQKAGGEAVANYDSVATTEGGQSIIKTALDSFGGLDILVNNAGFLRDRMIFNMAPEEWDAVVKVHLYGHFNCIQPACAWFRQQWKGKRKGGRIINTSSVAGSEGNRGQINYAAAKEGIVGLTRSLALDMGGYGVTANAIRPAASTRMNTSPEVLARWKELGRTDWIKAAQELTAEGVAPLIVYLASDAANNINGCVFSVEEGKVGIYREPIIERVVCKGGRWTYDELHDLVPRFVTVDRSNPAPPEEPK